MKDSPKLPDEDIKLPPDVPKTIGRKRDRKSEHQHKSNGKSDVNPNDPYDKVRWANRRRMAWTSLVCMVIVTIALIWMAGFTAIDMKRFETISEPLSWSYFGFLSVIGAYMGFTTWASKGKR